MKTVALALVLMLSVVHTTHAANYFSTAAKLVSEVRKFEASLPGVPVAKVVTKMRKCFYDGEAIPNQPSTKEKVMNAIGMAPWDLLIADAADTKAVGLDKCKKFHFVTAEQEADWSAAGQGKVDIGHLMTGLDSMLHPRPATLAKTLFGFTSGVGPSTWSGDVGSTLSQFGWSHHDTKFESSDERKATLKKLYLRMNSPADQNGNLDGVATGFRLKKALDKSTTGTKLSDILEEYYTKGQWRQGRYADFMVAEFGEATQTPQARKKMKKEIHLFAKGYWRKSAMKKAVMKKISSLIPWNEDKSTVPWTAEDEQWVINMFLDDLRKTKNSGAV